MTFRTKMIVSGSFFFGGVALVAIFLPTFGRRCAEVYEPGSAKYERCIDRLITGGSVHFYKRTVLEPVNE